MRSRKRGSGSGPFLMEMILVTGFFIICASICVLVYARANRLSQRASDINQAVLEAQTLVEEFKSGQAPELGTILPSREFMPVVELTDEQQDRRNQIVKAEDYQMYVPAWDGDWNRYADAGALSEADKELAYVGVVYSGTVDHMQMIDLQIFRYETGSGGGSLLFQLSADNYIKP